MRRRRILCSLIIVAFVAVSGAAACTGDPVPLTCTQDSDCFQDGTFKYACDTLDTGVCLRACTNATVTDDCLTSQFCDEPAVCITHAQQTPCEAQTPAGICSWDTDPDPDECVPSRGICRDGLGPSGDGSPGDPGPGDPGTTD